MQGCYIDFIEEKIEDFFDFVYINNDDVIKILLKNI